MAASNRNVTVTHTDGDSLTQYCQTLQSLPVLPSCQCQIFYLQRELGVALASVWNMQFVVEAHCDEVFLSFSFSFSLLFHCFIACGTRPKAAMTCFLVSDWVQAEEGRMSHTHSGWGGWPCYMANRSNIMNCASARSTYGTMNPEQVRPIFSCSVFTIHFMCYWSQMVIRIFPFLQCLAFELFLEDFTDVWAHWIRFPREKPFIGPRFFYFVVAEENSHACFVTGKVWVGTVGGGTGRISLIFWSNGSQIRHPFASSSQHEAHPWCCCHQNCWTAKRFTDVAFRFTGSY